MRTEKCRGQVARWRSSLVLLGALAVAVGCASVDEVSPQVAQTLQELAMENARTCEESYTYPQALIDGLSHQLIEELRCMDPGWLEYYEPCQDVGCIWPHGPQPYAARPEVLDALYAAAASKNDYITIAAGYRDVAMQYFSRWFRENCNPNFHAAVPGESNHQGGRAIDVRSYDYWRETLFDFGFEHPIPTDRPHYELVGDATFRAESLELRGLSVLAFQTLWNRNNPSDLLIEDALYGSLTKAALGASPVAGFPIWGCEHEVDPCGASPCGDGCDPGLCDAFCEVDPCGDGCDPTLCDAFCEVDPCGDGCDPDRDLCASPCEVDPCGDGCDPTGCPADCDVTPCHPSCALEQCELFCEASPCDEVCPRDLCPPPDPNPCRDETCAPEPPEPSEPEPGGDLGPTPDALTGGGCAAGGASAAWPWALLMAVWFLCGRRQFRARER